MFKTIFTKQAPQVGQLWNLATLNPLDISTLRIVEVKGKWVKVTTETNTLTKLPAMAVAG